MERKSPTKCICQKLQSSEYFKNDIMKILNCIADIPPQVATKS